MVYFNMDNIDDLIRLDNEKAREEGMTEMERRLMESVDRSLRGEEYEEEYPDSSELTEYELIGILHDYAEYAIECSKKGIIPVNDSEFLKKSNMLYRAFIRKYRVGDTVYIEKYGEKILIKAALKSIRYDEVTRCLLCRLDISDMEYDSSDLYSKSTKWNE